MTLLVFLHHHADKVEFVEGVIDFRHSAKGLLELSQLGFAVNS